MANGGLTYESGKRWTNGNGLSRCNKTVFQSVVGGELRAISFNQGVSKGLGTSGGEMKRSKIKKSGGFVSEEDETEDLWILFHQTT